MDADEEVVGAGAEGGTVVEKSLRSESFCQ